jgi:23S rRNA (cytidine1920-2'-O)/16S rRNA (cytidine1409-2'-O)-methyltransferase
VEGNRLDKAGHLVSEGSLVEVSEPLPYVSRAGLKLEAALKAFPVSVEGKTILDVGASTGGFTHCLLKFGAARVVAVDVGYGQMHPNLRNDSRVVLLERTNARYLRPGDVPGPIHGAVLDVSFISLELLVVPISDLLEKEAFAIALVKPQFEVGRGKVGKGGVVRDPLLHSEAIEKVRSAFLRRGWTEIGLLPSPIKGPKGNLEFLLGLKRP